MEQTSAEKWPGRRVAVQIRIEAMETSPMRRNAAGTTIHHKTIRVKKAQAGAMTSPIKFRPISKYSWSEDIL